MSKPLRVAFIHPDLGIGGAERLVVDAAIGLQALGHSLIIYTSHHDPKHCFEETRNGELEVHHVVPPFPRSIRGRFHILFAHAKQLHLTLHLLWPWAPRYDVYFVDQLSACVPFLRAIGQTPVVFYCHFPDKLLANGEFSEGNLRKKRVGLLKRIYRYPMDWLEEVTTRQADVILSNSNFTARVFRSYFPSIRKTPQTVYPGINISAYETAIDASDLDIIAITSDVPTLLSLNRFEKKKNAALAVTSFAKLRPRVPELTNMRLVLAGGYDPRLEDNMQTLYSLIDLARSCSLTFDVITSTSSSLKIPPLNTTPEKPDVLFLLNFSTQQRTALLTAVSTRALLYTPANEHFGIVPVEAMCCGLPVLACNSGGPTESIISEPAGVRTGWLCPPDPDLWAEALAEIIGMNPSERTALSRRAKERARDVFGMQAMASRLDRALREAVALGAPDSGRVWWLMVIGFLLAYFISTRLS
ncbi:alpha-1,3-mannosyltransferase ALG2 [Mycena belliarum]|uniref:Alpha-1,3/1,6-mannosyltransferase ALG2 n=1 Tax=Mycena belliarum TaxID=1033014 RepID=A0AAD6TRN3_9AGAR|nr:alpha-1,3-mannosyltransferase ALG2 [Mycena belliae]